MPKKRPSLSAGSVGVIYGRYSSHNQKDISIEQQVALCRKLAEERKITVKDIYADRAISGKTDKRPAFQKMLKDSESGSFNYVIAWKSSRIGRNMLEAMVNECRLADNGVRILYVEEDFDDTAAIDKGYTERWQLAELFGVTEEFINRAVYIYKAIH